MGDMCPKPYDCYICGYPDLDEDPKMQDYNICPSCGVEFGYDDWGADRKERHESLRQNWVERGYKWWAERAGILAPEKWDGKAQLEAYLLKYV